MHSKVVLSLCSLFTYMYVCSPSFRRKISIMILIQLKIGIARLANQSMRQRNLSRKSITSEICVRKANKIITKSFVCGYSKCVFNVQSLSVELAIADCRFTIWLKACKQTTGGKSIAVNMFNVHVHS